MEITSLCIILSSLSVSPDRSQFFDYESVSLSCAGNSTGWSVKRQTAEKELGTCGRGWGSVSNSFCLIRNMYTVYAGKYWCESDSGELSDTVNITVTGGGVILESPPLPVKEGSDVTLRCAFQDKRSKEIFNDVKAYFYKDGSLIRTESTREMTIPAVSKSDEGLYKCKSLNLEESPESWLAVRDTSCNPTSSSSLPFILSVVGAGVSVCLVVLLVVGLVLWWKRRARPSVEASSGDVMYARISIHDTQRRGRREEQPQSPLYSTVRFVE